MSRERIADRCKEVLTDEEMRQVFDEVMIEVYPQAGDLAYSIRLPKEEREFNLNILLTYGIGKTDNYQRWFNIGSKRSTRTWKTYRLLRIGLWTPTKNWLGGSSAN
jgi:hypothetical protein